MEKLIAYVVDGLITIQRSEYIEDGMIIRVDGSIITLIEIPYGGGDEIIVGTFNTIIEAFNHYKTLS